MDLDKLKNDYGAAVARAERLRMALVEQVAQLVSENGVTLGVPIESRVKAFESIATKMSKNKDAIRSLTELNDLVGLRLILLFRRDLVTITEVLNRTLSVVSFEDTAERLSEKQFGYQSKHFLVTIPPAWGAVPSFAGLVGLRAEIQVRTLAQHIWAAASHKLQYKQEGSVPPPIRRSIHRVSALLETVDLEFDRVLDERRLYVEEQLPGLPAGEPLNVDLVASILDEIFPATNKTEFENYSELIVDLRHFGIDDSAKLKALVQEHRQAALAEDAKAVGERRGALFGASSKARLKRGVFFTHTGLARQALDEEFPEKFGKYLNEKFEQEKGGGTKGKNAKV